MQQADLLREQAAKVARSGALGRSRSYARLLEFLAECSAEGRTPKEVEIAVEVFGRGADFDPSQDSMVRVYAHNLRQKLEHYYATEGRDEPVRLAVARGEYRLVLTGAEPPAEAPAEAQAPPAPEPARRAVPRLRAAVAAVVLLAVGAALGLALGALRDDAPESPYAVVAASPIWAPLLDDDLPTLVVVGDYYIFGELDEWGGVERLVRDFGINSSRDLDELLMYEPDLQMRYMDLDLTYLPRGTAFALIDLLRVLYESHKPVRVVSMSELNVAEIKSNHVLYVGYISGLDKLEEFVFASSALEVGQTYDELINKETGTLYTSQAGIPAQNRNYRDYGLISTFPGPAGNHFLIVAGTRDAGLMQSAHTLADPALIRSLEQERPEKDSGRAPAFETLYEVTGFRRTNLDAMLVHSAPLSYQAIWGGNLLSAY
ncbi:MAG TPA: hypothetical protein VIN61_06250 [Gammaproteobacteria bacterium]